jgi:RND family efflux transporter MFP subunit
MSPDKQMLDELRIDRSGSPRGGAPIVAVVVVLALLGLGAGWYWWSNRPKAATVRTLVVQEAAASNGGGGERVPLNASGHVKARREATISSKVTGKVMELFAEEGMKVEAGQVLARLDSSNVERSMHLAEAQLESARKALEETRANLARAERELTRTSKLTANKVTSESDLDRVETEARSLRARLLRQEADISVAEHEVALWKQQQDDTVIRAPFSGIVTSKNAQPGEMISPMSVGGFTRTGICTVVDMSSLEVEVDVNESYINRVAPGAAVEATLDAYPDWRIPSKVIAIIPTADRQKATVKVRVGFEKLDPRILPDMGVKVVIQPAGAAPETAAPAAKRTIQVPKAAVRKSEGRDVVWLMKDETVERRAVSLGASHGDDVEIIAGLNSGDKVVIDGGENLSEGTRVTEAKR